MFRLTRSLVVLATMLSLSACGVSGNLRSDPGFAAFKSPGILDTDRKFALSLGPLPLRLARAVMDEDPEITALLRGLKAVRIYIYDIDADSERVKRRLELTATELTEQGWMPIITVREDEGLISALVKMDHENQIRGLVVIAQDRSELILVNLIGQIRPEMFSVYMAELDISVPDMSIDPG